MLALSRYSTHIPTCKECMKCKFKNDCKDGELCIIHTKANSTHASRKEYDREYKRKKKLEKEQKKNVLCL